MNDFSKYENKLPRPTGSVSTYAQRTKKKALDDALKHNIITKEEYDSKIQVLEIAIKEIQSDKTKYYEETERLFQLFKKDLFEYYSVEDNPKRELLYDKAKEMGSVSFYETNSYFSDLVELIE
jgi:formylmethanofuran dehydrogenase subunit E